MTVALFGFGAWGRNVARNLDMLAGRRWRYLVEPDRHRRQHALHCYPNLRVVANANEILHDDAVTAAMIVTPAASHAPLAKSLLLAGKHLFVEKPLALSVRDAVELAALADRRGLVLMVGHIFEYAPAVRRMRRLVETGEVGDLLYLHSQRLNFGRVQPDINAFWSLGPHDVSIGNFLTRQVPQWVTASGASLLRSDVEDALVVAAGYPNGMQAHWHVSWLDPAKTRRTTVVGSRRMLVFDDTEPEAKLRVYDKHVSHVEPDLDDRARDVLHGAAVSIPLLRSVEPLTAEVRHFLDCADNGKRPRTDGWTGVDVVAVLEAAQISLRSGGTRVPVDSPSAQRLS